MPEESQDDNQEPNTNISPDNTSQYIKQPQNSKITNEYNPEPVIEQVPENDLSEKENEIMNSEALDTPEPAMESNEPTNSSPNSGPIPAVVNPFQQSAQPDIQQSIKTTGPKLLKNKKLVIGLVIAAVVVLLGSGSALAYTSWYQNPKKVLADSLINAFTAKDSIYEGTLAVDGDFKLTIDATSKKSSTTGSLDIKVTAEYLENKYSVKGGGLIDKNGDLYFMVDGISEIVADIKSSSGLDSSSPATDAIDKIVEKIDGTWVKVSSDDLKEFNNETSTAKTCLDDATEKFKNDKSAINEVADIYRENPFILIKKDLGQKDGNFGYEITNDSKALKTFADSLKDTKIYKELNDCDKNIKIDTSDMDITEDAEKSDDGTVELWIGTWSHQINKIVMSSENEGTKFSATITAKHNQKVEITAPADFISLKELKEYIDDLVESFSAPTTFSEPTIDDDNYESSYPFPDDF